jgi:ATP-dependent Clp protease adaptor protein ClpS
LAPPAGEQEVKIRDRAPCASAAACDIPAMMFPVSTIQPVRAMAESKNVRAMADKDDGSPGSPGVGIATRTRAKAKKPSMYKVLLLNDDYTPMEFVVMVLQRFFNMDIEQATQVMLHVHQQGVGVCGVFSYEVAETKVNQVMDAARQNQHPLQCTLEKA